jgi:hypothetical protein
MGERRHDGFGEKGPRDAVCECAPVVAVITSHSMAQLGIGVQAPALRREDSCPDKRGVIEAVVRCQQNLSRVDNGGSCVFALRAAKFGTTQGMRLVCWPSEFCFVLFVLRRPATWQETPRCLFPLSMVLFDPNSCRT